MTDLIDNQDLLFLLFCLGKVNWIAQLPRDLVALGSSPDALGMN